MTARVVILGDESWGKTKVANLIKCGINKSMAYEWGGDTRKGYWRIADSFILHRGNNQRKPT